MTEERTTGPGGACPPHTWRLSTVAIDGERYDHHECRLCGAQKDVPQTGGAWRSTWPGRPRPGDARPPGRRLAG
jgi:hypothetical protein